MKAARFRLGAIVTLALVSLLVGALPSGATTAPQPLPFGENWAAGSITANDDWSTTAGIVGYLGDDASTTTADIDPRTRTSGALSTTVDVIADQTSPGTLTNGGVADFELTDPVVALQGSGTADAPNLVIAVNTTGASSVNVAYDLRDIDGSADNAVQQVALQYRVGDAADFTNVAAGYVADATTGPSLATLVTHVSAALPADAADKPLVQIRVITTNAGGSDEWVGVDAIAVTGAVDAAPTVSATIPLNGATGVVRNANIALAFSEPVTVTDPWYTISCPVSGTHAATQSGGPSSYMLDPLVDFAAGETCTVTIAASGVSDVDGSPTPMASNFVFSFTTAGGTPGLPFVETWTDTSRIVVNDDWSRVTGIVGYLGDDATSTATDIDPQTRTSAALSSTIDVIANQTNVAITNGGVAEFQLADPTIALQGSGTADGPNIVISVNTTGADTVHVAYNLRDIDGTADDAVQQVALQYRIGDTGAFTNVPAGYVADATGAGAATQVTPVSVNLPAEAGNKPLVQIRVITSNAGGNDEWVGVDEIHVTSAPPEDLAPQVTSTSPSTGATGVAVDANVTVTFSEDVNVGSGWYSIDCATSGAHTAVAGGGPTSFTLNPDSDFASGETCTVTVVASAVTDQDANDPPDNMAGNHSWTFTTVSEAPVVPIHDIQGAGHASPEVGHAVTTTGIVTAKRSNGFYMQDPSADANDATSEGILVFTSSAPTVNVGDSVRVNATVQEFIPGGSSTANLSTTELTAPTISVLSTGNALPTATVVGAGGRVPPTTIIDNDSFAVFDPSEDGIDFYESLEGMRLQVNNPVVVGPRNSFGEIWVLADDGAGAAVRTVRGGIVIRPTDFNPERIQLDDAAGTSTPNASVGDHFNGPAIGVLDYDFGNFELEVTSALTTIPGGLAREVTPDPAANELAVATFNVENLDANEPQSKFDALAHEIVDNLRSPDVIALEEIQDNNGATNDSVVDATQTLTKLANAVHDIGGPVYDWRQISPVDDQDGGEPGGNIRVGFFFRTDRGLSFVDRAGGTATAATGVSGSGDSTQLTFSPGRVAPTNTAWNASRKPLAGEFRYHGQTFFLIANHFNSKGGDQPLFGRFQPPARSSEVQRHQQAQLVNDFVDSILAADSEANIVVLGDINDFEFSETMNILTAGGVLHDLMNTLPQEERYSYVFEGNSQVLDHIVVSSSLAAGTPAFDPVHINAEFFDQLSDHDPSVARFFVNSVPTVDANGPYSVAEGSSVTLSATGSDPDGDAITYAWDLDDNGTFETTGPSVTFSAATIDGPATRTVTVRVSDATSSATDQATITITNVEPSATFNAPTTTFAGFPFTLSLTNPSDPAPADTTFTYAFDCGSGYGSFGSAASTSCPTSDPGTRSVGGKIADDDGGISEYRATVNVVVTFVSLCNLVREVVTSADVANALCDKLNAAAAAAARGNTSAKQNQLTAFRNQVDAQVDKSITLADAELLKRLSLGL